MIRREIEKVLKNLSHQYPVVTITGPRQSGKTTLVRAVFKNKDYVNLEHPEDREFAQEDPQGFLNRLPDGGIIDEIQRVPELLSYIQVICDNLKKDGMFILTGSNQFELMDSITQSLAGRTALLKLLPFSFSEIKSKYDKNSHNIEDIIYSGFYPRLYDRNIKPYQFYADYFETYIQRDLRQIVNVKDLRLFQKFVKLCASRIGQLLNLSGISNDLGITHTTVREWINILQTSYIVFLLEPFYKNIKKRLIKTPKLYFYDVGLAAHLLGMESTNHVENHPLKGNLFENLVISEILKNRYNDGKTNNLNFFRDRKGNEVDVIYNIAHQVKAIEIKSSQTIHNRFINSLNNFSVTFPNLVKEKVIVYGGIRNEVRHDTRICGIYHIQAVLRE